MSGYRPHSQVYGHPPPQLDPYQRPGSTPYGQLPPQQHHGAPGYGSPINQQAPWGQNQYQGSQPLPPPPPGGPPPNRPEYNYAQQTGPYGQPQGAYQQRPGYPPQQPPGPYGQATATPPPNAGPQGFRPPGHTAGPPPGHQRAPSRPNTYQQEVAQHPQAWPQHPQYSTQPTTHRYDPPLPPRPSSQGQSGASGLVYHTSFADKPAPPQPPQASAYPGGAPGHPPCQQPGYEPSPSSASVYSPDVGPEYPPRPPKVEGYPPQQQPPRPAFDQAQYQGHYAPTPPQQTAPPPQGYGNQQHPPAGYPPQQPPRPPSRPYSNPQGPPVFHRPSVDEPVSPLHGRQSVSIDRPASVVSSKSQRQSQAPPPAAPPVRTNTSTAFGFSSDWEHFGSGADEIDDTAMYGVKSDKENSPKLASVELPGSESFHGRAGSEVSALDSHHVSPAMKPQQGTPQAFVPTPSPNAPTPPTAPSSQPPQHQAAAQPPPAPPVNDEADYIPPMPNTPPAAQKPTRAPIVIGGTGSANPSRPSSTAPSFNVSGGYEAPPQPAALAMAQAAQAHRATPPPPTSSRNSYHQPQNQDTDQGYAMGGYSQYEDFYNQKNEAGQKQRPTTPPQSTSRNSYHQPQAANQGYAMGGYSQHEDFYNQKSAAAQAPATPGYDQEAVHKAQQEAQELNSRLFAAESQLGKLQANVGEKEAALANKDAVIAQKDSEISQRAEHLKDMEKSLAEITETYAMFKTSTEGLEHRLAAAESAKTDLEQRLSQSETAMNAARETHQFEADTLNKKLADLESLKASVDEDLEEATKAKTETVQQLEELTKAKAEADQKLQKKVEEKNDLNKEFQETKSKFEAATAETTTLRQQLEKEKSKAEAKAKEPIDIAPGLDPWFKGSLERYKEMIETESKPIPMQERLQLFMDFVNSEARLRGIDMPFGPNGQVKGFNVPPPQPPAQKAEQAQKRPDRPRVTPPKESDGFVMVDPEAGMQFSPGGRPIIAAQASSEQYSPGGRPIMNARTTTAPAAVPVASASTPVVPPEVTKENAQLAAYQKPAYKPFSQQAAQASRDRSGSVPMNAAPAAPTAAPAAPIYKPLYKPNPAAATPSPPTKAAADTPILKTTDHPDIFLDHVPGMKIGGKREAIKSPEDQTMLPLPLKPKVSTQNVRNSFAAELPATSSPKQTQPPAGPAAAPASASPGNPSKKLSSLLPENPDSPRQSQRIKDVTRALDAVNTDYSFVSTTTKSWEEKATATRKNLEKERTKRQAELERRNDELFANGEIGYGDFETLEGQAKEEEMRAKAEEEAEEYQSYAKEVFDVVFKRCQDDIQAAMKVQSDIEALLRDSSAGEEAVSGDPQDNSLSAVMGLFLSVHEKLEKAQGEVTKAVAERDRRYKLTQTKPLYAKGDIAGMKRVEKAFEEAERKGDVRSRVERAERCKRVWKMLDAEMERGAGEHEDYAADLIAAAEEAVTSSKNLDSMAPERANLSALLDITKQVLGAVYTDTEALMSTFEKADILLNECEYEVSVASAKLKGDGKEYFERLEREKKKEDVKLKEDGVNRINIVRGHRRDAEAQIDALINGGKKKPQETPEEREEREAKERKMKALEDARRRNGEA